MFENSGEKLIVISKIIFWISIAALLIITGIFFLNGKIYDGIAVLIFGAFGSWIECLLIYAIGEIHDYTVNRSSATSYEQRKLEKEIDDLKHKIDILIAEKEKSENKDHKFTIYGDNFNK